MTTDNRSVTSRPRGRGRGRVFTGGSIGQAIHHGLKPQLRGSFSPSATPPPTPATETAAPESSNTTLSDAPLPPPVIRMVIWPDGMSAKIYDHRIARRLQQMLHDIREEHDHLTIWICQDIKRALDNHFSTDEGFRHRHLINRANRTSPRSSKYTGGSATFMKTKSRLSNSLENVATLAETFRYTHTLKANKKRFADEGSVAHYQSQPNGDDPNFDASVVNCDRVWHDSASESYKNRISELGSFFASGLHNSTLAASSVSASTTSPVDPEEVIDLRE
ncbi:hypothetical protein Ahy_A01g000567 [Arachis hypogaea]|uniref:Uncharacterized protein n=1 Tax=Arachis hypogaea TaxID=3818 RepID=A0A445EKJ0_ARAHY|nr:hypothetical protein Ahy_A01g000567 [Arachis hypogaea]